MQTQPTHWRRRLAGAGVGAALLATVMAGCTSGTPGRQVASLSGGGGVSATTSTLTVDESEQSFVDFARCLRAHGLHEPDPTVRPGQSGFSVVVPPPSAANRSALSACNHFIAKIEATKEAGASKELSRWLPSLVRYAACMRSHDIPMLDPGPQGQLNLGNVPGITSDYGRYSPQFRSADGACRHLLPAGVRDDGTGP
jgi:hypothetical protein